MHIEYMMMRLQLNTIQEDKVFDKFHHIHNQLDMIYKLKYYQDIPLQNKYYSLRLKLHGIKDHIQDIPSNLLKIPIQKHKLLLLLKYMKNLQDNMCMLKNQLQNMKKCHKV
jgi:hypothetical protein